MKKCFIIKQSHIIFFLCTFLNDNNWQKIHTQREKTQIKKKQC
ncbi:hypothetical protein DDB_G0279853 [Dictyostelium discoideum AX4]|uniref:Uncharacterized protein DDB_G0279853 n=1 Tax=Dictyostelium discoideum TaxID=44689 RepID=Y8190_DICDI|nr:hypothetical protein DDB_G0279853 [Dictyostelium discoideum AX4]Q54WA5.1 RecName: Full=Uncharacterized protein DDB_G0279853 [Dictyostelium discoideum]EAL67540.1 hypothetical protein DDB_G0279853 [Dictyostelium discoideum AX4]|eukprot:XP_641487.1 hypothetical protein DDB_G0279853 [Dictyostelium discoideum AX4]